MNTHSKAHTSRALFCLLAIYPVTTCFFTHGTDFSYSSLAYKTGSFVALLAATTVTTVAIQQSILMHEETIKNKTIPEEEWLSKIHAPSPALNKDLMLAATGRAITFWLVGAACSKYSWYQQITTSAYRIATDHPFIMASALALILYKPLSTEFHAFRDKNTLESLRNILYNIQYASTKTLDGQIYVDNGTYIRLWTAVNDHTPRALSGLLNPDNLQASGFNIHYDMFTSLITNFHAGQSPVHQKMTQRAYDISLAGSILCLTNTFLKELRVACIAFSQDENRLPFRTIGFILKNYIEYRSQLLKDLHNMPTNTKNTMQYDAFAQSITDNLMHCLRSYEILISQLIYTISSQHNLTEAATMLSDASTSLNKDYAQIIKDWNEATETIQKSEVARSSLKLITKTFKKLESQLQQFQNAFNYYSKTRANKPARMQAPTNQQSLIAQFNALLKTCNMLNTDGSSLKVSTLQEVGKAFRRVNLLVHPDSYARTQGLIDKLTERRKLAESESNPLQTPKQIDEEIARLTKESQLQLTDINVQFVNLYDKIRETFESM